VDINTISFSVVKNEADIIEAFVRHNLQYIDHMVIADNMSTDNTLPILYSLKKEGLPLDILHDQEPAHDQSQKMTVLYFLYAEKHRFRYAFFLDADEFLYGDKTLLAQDRTPGIVFSLPLRNYILESPEPLEKNPLLAMRFYQKNQKLFPKVMLCHDPAQSRHCAIADGNHHIVRHGNIVDAQPAMGLCLAHFPVRSKNQFLSKIIMGKIGLALRDIKDKDTGAMWHRLFQFLQKHEFAPSGTALLQCLYKTDDMARFVEEYGELAPVPVNFSLQYAQLIQPVNILNAVLLSYMNTLESRMQE
jgi:hypothetical protein